MSVDATGMEIPPTKATTLVDPENTTLIVMIGVLFLSALVGTGIVLIMIFSKSEDQKGNITLLTGALSPVLIALVGILLTKKTDAVHIQLNHRMDELLNERSLSAQAKGELVGRDTVRAEINDQAIAMKVAESPNPVPIKGTVTVPEVTVPVEGSAIVMVDGKIADTPTVTVPEATVPIEDARATPSKAGVQEGSVVNIPTVPAGQSKETVGKEDKKQ